MIRLVSYNDAGVDVLLSLPTALHISKTLVINFSILLMGSGETIMIKPYQSTPILVLIVALSHCY